MDPTNESLKARLKEANDIRLRSAASASSSGGATVMDYVYNNGDRTAMRNSAQFGLRTLILLFSVGSIFLGRFAWSYAILLTGVNHLISLLANHGKPSFTQEYGQRIIFDPLLTSLFYCMVMYTLDPFIVGLVPIVTVEAVHFSHYLSGLLSISSPALLNQLQAIVDSSAPKILNDPSWVSKR
jgi:hypothetical protein